MPSQTAIKYEDRIKILSDFQSQKIPIPTLPFSESSWGCFLTNRGNKPRKKKTRDLGKQKIKKKKKEEKSK